MDFCHQKDLETLPMAMAFFFLLSSVSFFDGSSSGTASSALLWFLLESSSAALVVPLIAGEERVGVRTQGEAGVLIRETQGRLEVNVSTWVFLEEMLRRLQGLDPRDGGSACHWTDVALTGRSALDVLLRTFLFLYVHESAGVIEGVGPVTGGEPAPALKRTGKFSCPLDEEEEEGRGKD